MRDFLKVRSSPSSVRVSYADKTVPRSLRERPFVIPIFIPQQGCPHRCAFCRQHTITDTKQADVDRSTFSAAVERFLNYPHRKRRYTQLAFFGGNFLGLRPDHIQRYLGWATALVRQGAVDSLRFSTRPDSISAETLALIGEYPVRTVELGVQSMDDRVLAKSQRGHGATHTTRAVGQLQNAGYEIGLQVMTGLPGDTPARATATIQALVALNPAFVRIYPTLVMAGSPLAADYLAGRYRPASLDESVDLAARLWLNLTAAGIPVVRMGLQDGPGLADGTNVLAGPYHPAFGELVLNRIFKAMAAAGMQHTPPNTKDIVVRVNPRRLSVMIGPHRSNITTLQKKFCLDVFQVAADERLPCNQLEVDNRQPRDASNP